MANLSSAGGAILANVPQRERSGEQYEMKALPKTAAVGAEAHWIDACWYGGLREWWQEVGSWTVNTKKFPHGLRPISDAAHAAGLQFVLWFEPERVRQGAEIHHEHPEFLVAIAQNPDNLLFNLGDPRPRQILTELLWRHHRRTWRGHLPAGS